MSLGKNTIGDKGENEFAKVSQVNKSIGMIDLEKNNIGNKGATELAQALQVNTSLAVIGLEDNNTIGDEWACGFWTYYSRDSTIVDII
jgi:Ran GTPase-activating protein (RanGAP) involved in mRNA processing and transport